MCVGVDFIILYLEIINGQVFCLIDEICCYDMKVGLIFNLEMLVEVMKYYIYKVDKIMVMIVDFGFVG